MLPSKLSFSFGFRHLVIVGAEILMVTQIFLYIRMISYHDFLVPSQTNMFSQMIQIINLYQYSNTRQMAGKSHKMNFIHTITLSPFEKYAKFDVFPWKFIFHLLLVIFTTYQGLKVVSIQDKHTRIQEQVFSTLYLANQDGDTSFQYYSLSDFTDNFFGIFNKTDLLNQNLLQFTNIENVEYKLDVYFSEMNPTQAQRITYQGNQAKFIEALGTIPIHHNQYQEMKKFIEEVESMHLQIRNIITYIQMDSQHNLQSCLNWTAHIAYNFESFANVHSELQGELFTCYINGVESKGQSLFMIHFSIVIISSLSLVVAWRQVYEVSKQYMKYKTEIKEKDISKKGSLSIHKNWDELGFLDKAKFFDFWFIVTAAGNFLQFFGGFVAILDESISINFKIFQHKELLIGFGVMLAWINILKYLQYSQSLSIMTNTLSKSSANLLMFLLGVMPFFFGFVFLGQAIFWKYDKFQDTSSTVITLFSILNGDIVNDTFLETWAQGLIGQIYLIIFMILFYTAVQNVLVTIIMEGYEESIKETEYKKKLEQQQDNQEQKFVSSESIEMVETVPQNPRNTYLKQEQQNTLNFITDNGKKADKLIKELCEVYIEIQESSLSQSQKDYLYQIIRGKLQSIYYSTNQRINKLRE